MKKCLLVCLTLILTFSVCNAQSIVLWGMTNVGGLFNLGTIFKMDTSGNLTDMHDFGNDTDGAKPCGSFIEATNGLLYGTTLIGGANNKGTLFSYDISTGKETVLHSFGSGTDGQQTYASLVQANDGLLYGVTLYGGVYSYGTLFSYNISTGKEIDLHDFGNGTDASIVGATLIQATDGLLYGTSFAGGLETVGQIFSYDITNSVESDVHDFQNNNIFDGSFPYGPLMQSKSGIMYGTTSEGGSYDTSLGGDGTIYSLSNGIETVLHDFGGPGDGYAPYGTLFQVYNGTMYGTTFNGGNEDEGVLFSYNISGETVLHSFYSAGGDGAFPQFDLIRANDSLLYGVTPSGGANERGSVFRYNISTGKETVVHSFDVTDGSIPTGDLLEVDSPSVTTNINQLSAANAQFSIYPSPTSGQFTIKLKGNQNGSAVEIINILGQTVLKSPLENSGVINLSSQPTGMYFVYLKSDEGVQVGKVLVTR